MKPEIIPIHNFSKDNPGSVPFRFIPLNQRSDYDTTRAHRHNYYEIFLFDKGGGYHEIDFGAHSISDKSIHFVAPGMIHKVRREPDSYGSILLFSRDFYHLGAQKEMSLYQYPFLNAQISGSPVVNLEQTQFDELLYLSRTMGNEKANNGLTNAEIIRTYLHIFLLKCKEYTEYKSSGANASAATYYHKLQQLLESHYCKEHLPSFYADELSISFKKLNDICKQHSGLSMSNMIKERLMLEAKRLLIHTDHSIKEIGYFLGFEDPAYFNRFFRKNADLSAGSFRKQRTGEE